ncbi:MAG: hypothetical protein QGG40_17435, partial [Myxococcota bacterium]|nr:hypothetical protein [Myxococcota bacterium]
MAEGLALAYALRRSWQLEAQSAGIMAVHGRSAQPHAIKVMRELDLDISEHKSQPMTSELVDWADYILVMEMFQGARIREEFPKADDRI